MHHVPIALTIQLIVYLLTQNLWIGATAGTWYFIGREYAQAEYRLIEAHYSGLRSNMPAWAPLQQTRAWTKKSVLDFVLPALFTFALAYAIENHTFFL